MGDFSRPCRSADLIVDDSKLLPLRCESKNREQEVSTARCVNPRGPENEMSATGLANSLLASQFRFSIDTDRIRKVGFKIWRTLAAIEYVVGGVVHQDGRDLFGFGR